MENLCMADLASEVHSRRSIPLISLSSDCRALAQAHGVAEPRKGD